MVHSNVPFGVSTKRFAAIGYHPDLDPGGSMRKAGDPIGPGHYHVKDIKCIFKKKREIESWTRKLELEEYSRTWGYKNTAILAQRAEDKKRGGPCHYDVNENFGKPCEHNVYADFTFGTTKREVSQVKNTNPGPGAYGVPYLKSEKKKKPPFQWTSVPTFEWDGLADRFKRVQRTYELPCNRYDLPLIGISALLAKVVSKKGPYNLFTGPRDYSSIKGYFAERAFKGAANWPSSLPSCFEELLFSRNKSRTGKFFRASRFPEREPETRPTPGAYELAKKYSKKQNRYAFNSSVTHVRPHGKWTIYPGPGRYEANRPVCKYKALVPEHVKPTFKDLTWQFKSKTGRTQYVAVEYSDF